MTKREKYVRTMMIAVNALKGIEKANQRTAVLGAFPHCDTLPESFISRAIELNERVEIGVRNIMADTWKEEAAQERNSMDDNL